MNFRYNVFIRANAIHGSSCVSKFVDFICRWVCWLVVIAAASQNSRLLAWFMSIFNRSLSSNLPSYASLCVCNVLLPWKMWKLIKNAGSTLLSVIWMTLLSDKLLEAHTRMTQVLWSWNRSWHFLMVWFFTRNVKNQVVFGVRRAKNIWVCPRSVRVNNLRDYTLYSLHRANT